MSADYREEEKRAWRMAQTISRTLNPLSGLLTVIVSGPPAKMVTEAIISPGDRADKRRLIAIIVKHTINEKWRRRKER